MGEAPRIRDRFRAFLPVVVDIETAGFDPARDAILEIALVILRIDSEGLLYPAETHTSHVEPFPGANLDPKALAFNGIDPGHPFRNAAAERTVLDQILRPVRNEVKREECTRAIMVAHNPIFDLGFFNAMVERCRFKRNPFHPFSSFDTATLGGMFFGQTVLARIATAANLPWDSSQAHSAIYDAEMTAKLFCLIHNQCRPLA